MGRKASKIPRVLVRHSSFLIGCSWFSRISWYSWNSPTVYGGYIKTFPIASRKDLSLESTMEPLVWQWLQSCCMKIGTAEAENLYAALSIKKKKCMLLFLLPADTFLYCKKKIYSTLFYKSPAKANVPLRQMFLQKMLLKHFLRGGAIELTLLFSPCICQTFIDSRKKGSPRKLLPWKMNVQIKFSWRPTTCLDPHNACLDYMA